MMAYKDAKLDPEVEKCMEEEGVSLLDALNILGKDISEAYDYKEEPEEDD